jgi:hypothetical protein
MEMAKDDPIRTVVDKNGDVWTGRCTSLNMPGPIGEMIFGDTVTRTVEVNGLRHTGTPLPGHKK